MEEYEKKILNTLIGMFGSEGKIKVLWTLYKNQNTPLTTYMILKYTGLRRSGLNRILKNFTEVGLILKEEYDVKRL
ncbi:MAG: helix-turn-helix domain-containing protein [Nitrososphaeria archaeon]